MGRYDYRQAFKNVSFCLFAVLLPHFGPTLVIGGVGKLVVFLVLAGLLVFVLTHSADIRKVIASCLQWLPISLFAPTPKRAYIRQSPAELVVPREPSLTSIFQRPPPFLAL